MRKRIIFVLACISLALCGCSDNVTSNSDSNTKPPVHSNQGVNEALPHEYDAILNNIINAYPWNDDEMTMVPENPELSYMYRRNSALSEIGFALIDLDGNGQMELILSDVNKPFIYDLYTISDGKAVHLADSGERYCYYVCENGYLENQWSGSAVTNGHDFYRFHAGKLDFVERITLDLNYALDIGLINEVSKATEDNCFFRSKSNQEKDYELVAFDEAMNAIKAYQNKNKPLTIEYTLLSEYIDITEFYTATKNDDSTYSYTFADLNGDILFEEEKVAREPKIKRISPDAYELITQAGTGLSTNWAVYCDVRTSRVSEVFQYVLLAQGDYVVYVNYENGEHSIIIQNIFDKSEYYKKQILTNCSPVAGDVVIGAKPTYFGGAVVTYLTGENYTETELRINFP